MKFIGDKQIAETYIAEQTHFKKMRNLLKIITQLLKEAAFVLLPY